MIRLPRPARHLAETPSDPPLWLQALATLALVALLVAMIWGGTVVMDPGPSEYRDIGRPAITDNQRR